MELLRIPAECRINKAIPATRFPEIADAADCILWKGNIKSSVTSVKSTITEKLRYEELQFFQVRLHSRNKLYDVGKRIYSNIKYPCVIEFLIGDAVIIGVCQFNAGALDFSENVNKRMFFSHILHENFLSDKAKTMIDEINNAIVTNRTIGEMYNAICNSVSNYRLSGTTKAHVERLITDMLGTISAAQKQLICKYCEPYKYHSVSSGGNRYTGKKSTSYTLIHDYEELWYCFMMYPATREVIENRKYRDIEDLIYSIDSKGW